MISSAYTRFDYSSFAFSRQLIWLGLLVSLPAVVDLVLGLWMFGGVVELRSLSQSIFYLTDGLKIGLAVPAFAWLFSRYLPYNKSLEQPGHE